MEIENICKKIEIENGYKFSEKEKGLIIFLNKTHGYNEFQVVQIIKGALGTGKKFYFLKQKSECEKILNRNSYKQEEVDPMWFLQLDNNIKESIDWVCYQVTEWCMGHKEKTEELRQRIAAHYFKNKIDFVYQFAYFQLNVKSYEPLKMADILNAFDQIDNFYHQCKLIQKNNEIFAKKHWGIEKQINDIAFKNNL